MPARDPREFFGLHWTMRAFRPERKSRGREIALCLVAICLTASLLFAVTSGAVERRFPIMRANLAAAASPPPSFLDHIYHFFCPWFGGCEEPIAESMGTNAPAITSAEPQPKPAQPAYAPATSAQAHEKASQRREEASDKPRKMTPDLVELIEEKLTQEQWSPIRSAGVWRRMASP